VTTILLIRHASHDLLGNTLAGRMPGVTLNRKGRAEAERLAERLAHARIGSIHVSPRERARETAAPIAARLNLEPLVCGDLDEIEFGSWTGRAYPALAGDPAWALWVERRSAACPPAGESILAAQRRIVQCIARLCEECSDGTLALVSHGDLIKAALAHFLASSLDQLERFDIAPASVSVVAAGKGWAQVRLVNDTGSIVAAF
jgi:broad specificity phosphatase PhoE